MNEHEQLQDHEQRITRLESGIKDLSDEIKRGNAANDKANEFLMQQNMHITDLLGGIQKEKAQAKTKEQEAHVATWQSAGKIAVAVSAAVSLVTVVINLLFH